MTHREVNSLQSTVLCLPVHGPQHLARAGGPKVHVEDAAPVELRDGALVLGLDAGALLHEQADTAAVVVLVAVVRLGQHRQHLAVRPVDIHVRDILVVKRSPEDTVMELFVYKWFI